MGSEFNNDNILPLFISIDFKLYIAIFAELCVYPQNKLQ